MKTVAVVAACVAGIALAAAAAQPARGTTAGVTAQTGSGLTGAVEKGICAALGLGGVADAAKRLLSRGKTEGTGVLLADVAVSAATSHCSWLVSKAVSAVGWIYRNVTTPNQPSVASILSTFATQQQGAIAKQITINGAQPAPAYIGRSVSAICSDMRAGRSPILTFEQWYPAAKLDVLGAMNGVARLVIADCPLDAAQANALAGAILAHLTDNQYAADHDPPVVVVDAPTETRYTDGTALVAGHWSSYDSSTGVSGCDVEVTHDGAWYQAPAGSARLAQGTSFAFAVRCRDRAGNWSAWAETSAYQA